MPPDDIAALLAVEMSIITAEIWRVKSDDSHWSQIYSPSACLSLYTPWNMRGRIEIRATSPREIREPKTGNSITCSLERTPEAIARDIAARLLPHAREHLQKAIEYNAQKRREEAIKNLKDRYLKNELPDEWRSHSDEMNFTNEYSKAPDEPPILAHRYYDGTIEIKTRLPIAKALKLIKQLKEIKC